MRAHLLIAILGLCLRNFDPACKLHITSQSVAMFGIVTTFLANFVLIWEFTFWDRRKSKLILLNSGWE